MYTVDLNFDLFSFNQLDNIKGVVLKKVLVRVSLNGQVMN